jgi:hypothetical protein
VDRQFDSEAIRLKRDFILAFYNRSLARLAKGDTAGADEDHVEALSLGYKPEPDAIHHRAK